MMEQRILAVLRANPRGLTAKGIANLLGADRTRVNQILYGPLKNQCFVDSSYVWHLTSQVPVNAVENQTETISADLQLSKVCKYYLNCLSLDYTNKISAFKDSDFTLDYVEINSVDVESLNDEEAISFMQKTAQLGNKVMYIGYPTVVYTVTNRHGEQFKRIAPIFLYQTTYDAGAGAMSAVPTINMEIMKQYCSNDESEQLHEMIRLENELGLNNPEAEFDMYDLVTRLAHIRQWNWKEEMNPESFSEMSMSDIKEDGIYNKAVLLRADASNYTQGLEHELLELSRLSESQYKGTALYDWIHNEDWTDVVNNEEDEEILEVLPLNTEQGMSIKKALSNNLTVITGPPGTGKSQVVTNLIVNLAWKGKKAIFSSKNNKAVDVVEKRVNGLTERPIMLRMGSNQGIDAIVTFLRDLMNCARPQQSDIDEYNEIKHIYDSLQARVVALSQNKQELINSRNRLDEIEKEVCEFRHNWNEIAASISETEAVSFSEVLNDAMSKYDHAQVNLQPFFVKLLWGMFSKSRISSFNEAILTLNTLLQSYHKSPIISSLSIPKDALFASAKGIAENLRVIAQYNALLSRLRELPTLESIDRQLIDIKKEQADIAHQLWTQWVKTKGANIPHSLRIKVTAFIAEVALNKDDTLSTEQLRTFRDIEKQLKDILPICAVTSLSVRKRVPFVAGMYDLLIIDEASQCDIASILPLLYRCKAAVIIGDPKQLSHITGLTNQQDHNLLKKYDVSPAFSFNAVPLYDYAAAICQPDNIVQLKDHHRCHGDIIEFSNKEFYNGNLRIATNYNRLRGETKLGVRWVNTHGTTYRPHSGSAYNMSEVQAIVNELKQLVSNNYKGSIGVVTPFKAQADKITKALEGESDLYNTLLTVNKFMADTVHKFQGDERDVMFFSTVISNGAPNSCVSFLRSTGNLFNVAITRAKSSLVVVGNQDYCKGCGVSYLEHFVEYVMRQEKVSAPSTDIDIDHGPDFPELDGYIMQSVSEWEKILYRELYKAGIKTQPQYPIDNYRLDLAFFHNGKCLDIEVDGERYHRSWNGELCYRDQLRNQRMFELGWDVQRFWVYEIRDRLPWCIELVKSWMDAQN